MSSFNRKKETPTIAMLVDVYDNNGQQHNQSFPKKSSKISLKDPSSGQARDYLCTADNDNKCTIYEIQSLNSTYGSFFVGSRVISDGNLYVSTPVDPLFFVLETLSSISSDNKWQPRNQLMETIPKQVNDALVNVQLEHICETNDSFGDDLFLYKFSTDRALKWLGKKQSSALQVIKEQMLSAKQLNSREQLEKKSKGGACSSTFKLAGDDKKATSAGCPTVSPMIQVGLNQKEEQEALEASVQVVCEYLSTEWRTKFLNWLNLTETALGSKKDKKVEQRNNSGAPAGMREADELLQFTMGTKTSQNGGKGASDNKTKKKQDAKTAGVKRLAKVNTKGMKSLTSFFGSVKKAKKE